MEARTRTKEKERRQQEQQILQDKAHRSADEVRIRALLHYGEEQRGILKQNTEAQNTSEKKGDTGTGSRNTTKREKKDGQRR